MENRIFFLYDNAHRGHFGFNCKAVLRFDVDVDFLALDAFMETYKGNPIFTLLSYDVKNSVEALTSENKDVIQAPLLLFVVAEEYVKLDGEHTDISHLSEAAKCTLSSLLIRNKQAFPAVFKPQTSKEKYLETVIKLKEHIQQGDFYEINYCQEFVANDVENISPISIYQTVNEITSAPFSAFFQYDDFALACGSPERYLQRRGNHLMTQPIKGTAPRGQNITTDEDLKNGLLLDPKERAENVMIVDLVRNDLSKIACKGSVKVPELFGIYSFPTVHQMISTVTCELSTDCKTSDIIKATFPMGSMTGAPKISAMNHSEKYEAFKRGIYAGSVGIVEPNGDFDWNVVIRSITMNLSTKTLSCAVGGAITIDCIPEKEYEECLIKVGRILAPFQV